MSIQGSDEWLKERSGHVTASCFKDVLAKAKSGESTGRKNYRMRVVTERLTGRPVEGYRNTAMAWGTEHEPLARVAYEAQTGAIVEEVGFCKHLEITWVGGSPDGLIGSDGGVEIKCPFASTVHVETLINGLPREHTAQIQGNMWVTGRKWWDFVSFDPRMPDGLQLYIERVKRDEIYIEKMATEIGTFLVEVKVMHERLMARAKQ